MVGGGTAVQLLLTFPRVKFPGFWSWWSTLGCTHHCCCVFLLPPLRLRVLLGSTQGEEQQALLKLKTISSQQVGVGGLGKQQAEVHCVDNSWP